MRRARWRPWPAAPQFQGRRGASSARARAQVKNAMFEYGRHLGLAFQVVDDILDFTQTSEQLGKPQARGLRGPRGQARCVVGARRRG